MREQVKNHLLLIGAGTALSLFSLFSILMFTSPENAGMLILFFLYLTVFLSSLGLFLLIGLGLRLKFALQTYPKTLEISFRQSLLLAILITASLLLQAERLLLWWVETILILFLVSIEVFFSVE